MGETTDSFQIVTRPEVGRCLVAVRDIEPLEIIFVDDPAAIGPHHDTQAVCLQCLRVHEGDYICPDCSYPMCDENCRQGEAHQRECSYLARLSELPMGRGENYMAVLALRLALLRDHNPNLWQDVDQLMDHEEERRKNEEEWNMFQTGVVDPLKAAVEGADDDFLHRLVGILSINCIGFEFKKTRVRGRGLYPLLSLISHSCISNARYTVSPIDFSVTLRARRRICEGEEILINYVPPIYGMPKRKHHIADEWYFNCRCLRCMDLTEFGTYASALKCSNCREGLILPENLEPDALWRCRFCMNPFDAEFIRSFVQNLEAELYTISNTSPSVKNLEAFMKKHAGDLHTKHYINLIAQRNIIHLLSHEAKSSREIQKKIVRYSKNFISIMSRLEPGYSQWRGIIQKKLNLAQLALLKLDLEEKKIDKNTFAEKSESVWAAMQEVEKCELVCTPSTHR